MAVTGRREFMGGALSRGLGMALGPLAYALEPDPSLLVVVFLRGACDGLNLVCPVSGEDRKAYEQARPNIAMPLTGAAAALPLDDRFALHPKAAALKKLYDQKKLAVIHAVGLDSNTRSHFDAQLMMELGNGKKTGESGWLARYLGTASGSSLPAASIGALVPTSLLDFPRAFSVADLGRMNLAGRKNLQEEQQLALASIYESGGTWLHEAGSDALRSMALLQKAGSVGAPKADYPKSDLGNRLKTLSQLCSLNLGLRVATLDMGGWDTHKYQGVGVDGTFAGQVAQLSDAVGAFLADLAANQPATARRTTVVVMTEFGRRLRENANRGTDHGHGGVFLMAGERVNGGKVYGAWPGLATEKLYERADLAVTTDYRRVLSEAAGSAKLFPGFSAPALGLLRNS